VRASELEAREKARRKGRQKGCAQKTKMRAAESKFEAYNRTPKR
jgi:hypothetical protein